MDKKAEKKYIELMKKKGGQGRLRIAMELRDFVLKLAKESIKNQNPEVSKKELQKEILRRIYQK